MPQLPKSFVPDEDYEEPSLPKSFKLEDEEKPSLLERFGKFFEEHPKIRQVFTGPEKLSEEEAGELNKYRPEEGKYKPGQSYGLSGPGFLEIPGVRSAAERIRQAGRESGNYWGGFAGSLGGDIADFIASGIDPRNVATEKIPFKRGEVVPPEPITDPARLLPEARTYVSPEGTAYRGELPLRQGIETPYRAEDSFNTFSDTQAAENAKRDLPIRQARNIPIDRPDLAPVGGEDIFNIANRGAELEPKQPEDLTYGLAKNKFGMGAEIPERELPKSFEPERVEAAEKLKSSDEVAPAEQSLEKTSKRGFINPFEKNLPKSFSPEEEGPQFARSEKGGIKVGQDIRRSAQELTTGYSGPLAGIMAREGMQNAIDATRHLGSEGRISVKTGTLPGGGNEFLEITDNGKGMNQKQLETVFSDLHSSGKVTEAGATGGKGVGKASYILGGEHFKASTVVFEGGKKVRYSIEGTPDQFMEHVPIQKEVVPLETPTGTTIRTQLKQDQEGYSARNMVDRVLEGSRGIKAKVMFDRYGHNTKSRLEDFKDLSHHAEGDKVIDTKDIKNNDVSLIVPQKDNELKPRTFVNVDYLNNGMYQFSDYHYFPEEVPNMPQRLLVDIKPKMEEGSPDYPFPVQRESVKQGVNDEIKQLISEKLANPLITGKKQKLRELYNSMPDLATNVKTTRRAVLYDPGNRLTPEELEEFQTSSVISNLAVAIDRAYNTILRRMSEAERTRLEGTGIVLDPGLHGVHIPNPDTKKSTILINPFITISRDNPEDAALNIMTTIHHEGAHIGLTAPLMFTPINASEIKDPRIGKYLQTYLEQTIHHGGLDLGHGIDFVKRLGDIYAKIGPQDSLGIADGIQEIISDKSIGGYNPEVQNLLRIYEESRGRPETTEDLLSGTGIKQEPPSGGKGNVPPGNQSNGERVSSAVNKLFSAIENAKKNVSEQEQLNRAERARRLARFGGVKEEGVEGASKQLGSLKGEYQKVPGQRLGLNSDETDTLFTAVKNANITPFEKARGYTALFKLLTGENPVRSELAVLDDVFGPGFSSKIIEMHGGLGLIGISLGKIANTMKAMRSSIDFSAPLRQGIGLIHRPEYREAFKEMFKFAGSEQAFKDAMSEIESHPNYLLSRDSGLFMAKHDSITQGEEAFMNNYLGGIPRAIRMPFDASERAYTGFLNKLRFDTFNSLIEDAKNSGLNPYDISATGERSANEVAKNIAKYINVASGRGGLGRLERIAPELNNVLWSPRLISSRLTTLNPKYYTSLDPFTKKEAIKSLFAIAAAGSTVVMLGALAGGKVSTDRLSADFEKVRFGKNVLDPWAGFQQPIVAASRLLAGKTNTRPQSQTETLENFGVNKLAPIASLAYEIGSAKKWTGGGNFINKYGENKYLPTEIRNNFVPMFVQDVTDLYKTDPDFFTGLGLTSASLFGMGVQNYPESKNRRNFRISQRLRP